LIENNKKWGEIIIQSIIIIIFAVLILFLLIFQTSGRENKIDEKIRSIGGEVISKERRNFFTGIGPFMVVGKGRAVYRIEYRIDGEIKEGWVRFGGLLGPDWRL
jgi:hypothetical protein